MGRKDVCHLSFRKKYYYYVPKYNTQEENHKRRLQFAEHIINLHDNKHQSYTDIAKSLSVTRQYISREVRWYKQHKEKRQI